MLETNDEKNEAPIATASIKEFQKRYKKKQKEITI